MRDRNHILTALNQEFARWEALLEGLSEAQLSVPRLSNRHSIKDELGHLHAWQQLSIARLEAAYHNTEPVMPEWLMGQDPESDEDCDDYNARIYERYAVLSGVQVHQLWSTGFQRFLELAAAIPVQDLMDTQKYVWLNAYALYDVLAGSYEHHHVDHYDALVE